MKHHYVPQFLLRAWGDTTVDGKVEDFRLDLPGVPSSRRASKHTGFEDDLYALTVERIANMDRQAVEKQFLRDVDNAAACIRLKLDSQGLNALTRDERVNWTRFLMSLRVRQPDIVDYLRTNSTEGLRQSLADQPERYEVLAGIEDPPSLTEWTERQFPGLVENFGMTFFHELVDNPDIGTKILRMKWWLWDFSKQPHELLLADHPCIFTHGIDDPNLVIALPISPRKAFLATKSERVTEIMRQQRSKDLVVRLNESSVGQARARVYGRDGNARRFIINRLARRPVAVICRR